MSAKQGTLTQRFGVLWIVFIVMAFLIVAQAIGSITLTNKGVSQVQDLAKHQIPSTNAVNLLNESVLRYESVNLRLMFAQDAKQLDVLKVEAKNIEEDMIESWGTTQGYLTEAEIASYKSSIGDGIVKMKEITKKLLAAMEKQDMFSAGELFSKEALPCYAKTREEIGKLKELMMGKTADAVSLTVGQLEASSKTVLGFGAVSLPVAVLGMIFLYGVSSSIMKLLKGTVNDLQSMTTQLKGGSSQMSSASKSLAEGASSQAASIEETSASLTEIASMTERNAQSAAETKTIAQQTREAAQQCRRYPRDGSQHKSDPERQSRDGGRDDRDQDRKQRHFKYHKDDRRDRFPDEPSGAKCRR
jgi:methyl-accepting chemotaxis protein